jgi:hypothetical protein
VPPLKARIAPLDVSVDADLLLRARVGNQEVPVLAVRSEGQGRVATWTGAPLWSWSFWRLGDDDHQGLYSAFVSSLVAWMAEGGDRQRVRLQIPRPVLARGESVRLKALALDRQLRPDARQDVWFEWAEAEGDTSVVGRTRMEPDSTTPGARTVEMPALAPGEYLVRARLEEGDTGVSSSWQRLTIDPYSVEFQDPRVDRLQLATLASTTGGRLVDSGEFEAWADELDLQRRRVLLSGRTDLGASLWLLLPLLGVLSAEWAWRKRTGLI